MWWQTFSHINVLKHRVRRQLLKISKHPQLNTHGPQEELWVPVNFELGANFTPDKPSNKKLKFPQQPTQLSCEIAEKGLRATKLKFWVWANNSPFWCDTVFVHMWHSKNAAPDRQGMYSRARTKAGLMTRNVAAQITQIWFQIRRDHPLLKSTPIF